jgi:hypothetical protein
LCSHCQSAFVDPPPFRQEDEPLVCARCQELPERHPVQLALPHHRYRVDSFIIPATECISDSASRFSDGPTAVSPVYHQISSVRSPSPPQHNLLLDQNPITYLPTHSPAISPQNSSRPTALLTSTSQPRIQSTGYPDPLVDITRIRVRSQSHHCLYPGATFQGTQKSGRNSYDVSVTIVDVNLPYFLCGYLRIRGLTDDWPELTTYFDAEIIGSRHGFLTQKWGADENADISHWNRFPAFRHVKGEMNRPNLTISDRDRGVVFMRWKEKFLVPDHRVQDVNGASFAGFYYVCVEFNPAHSNCPGAPRLNCDTGSEESAPSLASETSSTSPTSGKGKRARSSSNSLLTPHMNTPTATMNGFYYHQNSEPYQQLALLHVPDQTSSCFEFR